MSKHGEESENCPICGQSFTECHGSQSFSLMTMRLAMRFGKSGLAYQEWYDPQDPPDKYDPTSLDKA